jgi:hypothetical protein
MILYSSGGSQTIRDLTPFSSSELESGILFNACKLLISRGERQAANILASNEIALYTATNEFADEFFVLVFEKETQAYEEWRNLLDEESDNRRHYRKLFSTIAAVLDEVGLSQYDDNMYLRFIICQLRLDATDENWRTQIISATSGANNQGLFHFPNGTKLIKDGLNFRSQTEIKMYEALIKRGLLIFPLPVAVMGNPKIRREPDFVVAYKGKIGILEIHGEKWHPPETYAKEAERRRIFLDLGVAVYEVFDSKECSNNADKVIDKFLKAFER